MSRAQQLKRLWWVIRQPGGLRGLLAWKPFSLTAFAMLRALRRQGLAFGTILDGGANVGQFARAAAETYPEAQVICFEALPDLAAMLRRNLADRPQVRVVASALGSHDGTLTFYRNAYAPASSALPAHPNQAAAFPEVRQQEALEVPVGRLDTLLADGPLAPPVLLKLDLQGFELEALKGATETLRRTHYALLETAFKPMYRGEPLFDEVYAFMHAAGFRFLRPVDVLQDAGGEIVQMDALFAREPA